MVHRSDVRRWMAAAMGGSLKAQLGRAAVLATAGGSLGTLMAIWAGAPALIPISAGSLAVGGAVVGIYGRGKGMFYDPH